ncbi:MAG: hypothetical protein KIC98_09755 [Clostridioides difficile]|nr:hypothetical protein [Clostridioides difficile]
MLKEIVVINPDMEKMDKDAQEELERKVCRDIGNMLRNEPLYENYDDYKKGKKVIMKVNDIFENCKYNLFIK